MKKRSQILVVSIIAALCTFYSARAQYEHLDILNYNTLALTRFGTIPGVTYIRDKCAYDQNNRRFFFLGSANNGPPWQLYTIDAGTGSMIYDPLCPGGNIPGQVLGLEYDDATNTLYAIYFDGGGNADFIWIDPPTGSLHVIRPIAGYLGYSQSTFDTKDHCYIVNSGSNLLGIDASTGTLLFNWPNAALLSNLQYDNLTGKLFGIENSSTLPNPRFDSISLSTGVAHPIADIPAVFLNQLYTSAIDENAGKYIFVGSLYVGTCISDTLYELDVNTGAILSRAYYPWNRGNAINDQNVIDFNVDNKTGTLYALNWYPPNGYGTTLTESPSPYCAGSLLHFTVVPGPAVVDPFFQWQINGIDAGSNNPVFSSASLVSGDSVRCIITNNAACVVDREDSSASFAIVFSPPIPASISITASAVSVCMDEPVRFTALGTNTGSSPDFQWELNGLPVGTNDPSYTTSGLRNGDSVICILTANSTCLSQGPDSSNVVVIQVDSVPASLSISSSAVTVCSGDTVQFTATPVNGGNSPAYQWQVNGMNTGTNNGLLNLSTLKNGDIVSCLLTSSLKCAIPVPSGNSIDMTVNPIPVISFNPDTIILKPGEQVTLSPQISGNDSSNRWSPQTSLDDPFDLNPTASPKTTTVYQLTVISAGGCQASGKETVIIYDPLEMPAAFTPNADGRNDLFRIPPSTTQEIRSFVVFNRWGEMVFETANAGSGWDGTFNGHPQPPGVYVWRIEYRDLMLKRPRVAGGTVILIR